ncbi:MAG: IPT/TIG domain-containing protein [Acidobacteriales bacterium]|nr:IPT/TIG domain-containing protein [Terriglobales bacterium]
MPKINGRYKRACRFYLRILAQVFLILTLPLLCAAQSGAPNIISFSPASGPEATRVEINGENFDTTSAVLFGNSPATFKLTSQEKLITLVPHKTPSAPVIVVTSRGRAISPVNFILTKDPRIPDEVSYKAGYVSAAPAPSSFRSAMLWGIAIADIRVPGYEKATVEVAATQLSCRIDGKDAVLNRDQGRLRGGLYSRYPWFASDQHTALPAAPNSMDHAVILQVGKRPYRIWHFWAASPRAQLPPGKLQGCTVTMRVKISPGALLQVGFDYWRSPTIAYGPGGDNHEAGASKWYFSSAEWQDASFTDIGGPQF